MSIFKTIKSDLLVARKNKQTGIVKLLSTLVGEIENKHNTAKDKSIDDTALATIKLFIRDLGVMKKYKDEDSIQSEIDVLQKYQPTLMSREEILQILMDHGFLSLKDTMQHFKSLDKKADMKLVREVYNEI